MNNLEQALTYARNGWRVMPCWPVVAGQCTCGSNCGKSAGKHPLSTLAPRGVHDATSNLETVTEWWTKIPAANIAIATGQESGIFVVDIDSKSGGAESLQELQELHTTIPDTISVSTAHGGTHFYFAHPGVQVRNLVSSIGMGIDIRGDGGYVLAPPSSLGRGKDYSWIDASKGVLEPPEWLKEMVTGRQTARDPVELAAVLNGVPEGQRDFTLFRAICKLRAAGVPKEFAEDLAINAARKCDPPFDEGLAQEKVTRAYRQYRQDYAWTDVGNAERFIDRHGANLKMANNGKWYIWNGVRWNPEQQSAVMTLAIETTQATVTHAREMEVTSDQDRETRDELIDFARRSQNVNRLEAMVKLAATDPAIQIDVDEFDADPYLLNCPNGTVDLRTGELLAHNRSNLLSQVTRTPYDPLAKAPRWNSFLTRILPDPEVLSFVHRAVGYSMTGSVTEQCLFFLYGGGANGKSTLLNCVRLVLGKYAKMGTPDLLLSSKADSHPTLLADMVGARFVPSIETDDGKKMAEAQVKWLTGGDMLKARFMRRDYFEFTPKLKLWLAANHRPIIYGMDTGIWRRINLIPFTEKIPPEEQIKNLFDILAEEEAQGILNWCIQGAQAWMERGLDPPEIVQAALAEYKSDMDIMGQFMAECVIEDKTGVLQANDLYASYQGWCENNGEYHTTQRKFTNKISELGFNRERGAQNKYIWKGLALTGAGKEYKVLSRNSGGSIESYVATQL